MKKRLWIFSTKMQDEVIEKKWSELWLDQWTFCDTRQTERGGSGIGGGGGIGGRSGSGSGYSRQTKERKSKGKK